jgi:DNA-binding transcriptional LysR family regulator
MAKPGFGGSLDDLQSMAVFARVVETGSFSAAARALDTTTSSVSKRIARLEDQLGVSLLVRTTRAVAATDAGVVFHERCARILRDVADAELAVTELGSEPRGTLRVTALSVLGEGLLGPLLGAFAVAYPNLRIDVDLSDKRVNLVEEGFDLALRGMQLGAARDSSLIARRLATDRTMVCAAPSYLARRGVPSRVEDLVEHDILHYAGVPLHREWSFEAAVGTGAASTMGGDPPNPPPRAPGPPRSEGPSQPISPPVVPRMQVNSIIALRDAAIAGAGLIRASRLALAEAVRQGTLVSVLESYATTDFGLFAVHPPGKQALPKVTAFVSFLARELPGRLAEHSQ